MQRNDTKTIAKTETTKKMEQKPVHVPDNSEKSRRTTIAIYLLSLVMLILGLSYASVPLYQLFCQATGFGGTVQKTTAVQPATHASKDSVLGIKRETTAHMVKTEVADSNGGSEHENPQNQKNKNEENKAITINFNADVSNNLPWTFKPTMNKIKVYPGDTALTFYIAKNTSDHAISGISTYHVTPAKVGIYFNKIQCFCFEEQRLKPNESIEMPVLFFLDSDFKTDPKMQDVESITLSYTFYKSDFS